MWLCTIQAPFVKLYFLARVYDASIDPRRVRDRTSRDTRPEKALLTALPFGGKEGFHPLRVSSCRAREIEWRNDRGCTWRSIMYTCVLSRLYVKRKDKYRERERESKKEERRRWRGTWERVEKKGAAESTVAVAWGAWKSTLGRSATTN